MLRSTVTNEGRGLPDATNGKGDPVTWVSAPEAILNDETEAPPWLAEKRNVPVESTASEAGPRSVAKGEPATGVRAPLPWTLKLAILLFIWSAAYRNCPLESIVIPVMSAPTENGDPATSDNVPLVPIEKPEMVPEVPFETYTRPAAGDTARNCGFGATSDANEKGEPAIGVNKPLAVSMLKTEIVAGAAVAGGTAPWLRTNRNWPPELTPKPTGFEQTELLAQTGVGGKAVPIGVSMPAVWSTVKPDTVLEVRFATYIKFFEGCNTIATGRGLVPNAGIGNEDNSPVLFWANA